MKKENMLKIISWILASMSFAICLFLCGEINGFSQGYNVALHLDEKDVGRFGYHGPNFYDYTSLTYSIIALCFYIYIISRAAKEKTLSHIISILTLVIIIYQYWQILQFKKEIFVYRSFSSIPYNYWLLKSIQFDWFCLVITIILLIVQITLFFTYHFGKNNKST